MGSINLTLRTRLIDFKGHRVEKDIILIGVCWYLAYPLNYRHLEKMMKERGVPVDHSGLYRWVQKFTPSLEAAFRNGKKHPVGKRWRMDETYIKVRCQWKYRYHAFSTMWSSRITALSNG